VTRRTVEFLEQSLAPRRIPHGHLGVGLSGQKNTADNQERTDHRIPPFARMLRGIDCGMPLHLTQHTTLRRIPDLEAARPRDLPEE
jgi:hypothetical protein